MLDPVKTTPAPKNNPIDALLRQAAAVRDPLVQEWLRRLAERGTCATGQK